MHEHARRIAKSRCSIGVAISQYDLALVLMAFGPLPLDTLVTDMKVSTL